MLDSIHPNILALIAASLVSVARIFQRYAVVRLSTFATSLIMGTITAIAGWFFYWLEGPVERMPLAGVLIFMAMGIFGAGIGRYLYLSGIRRVGLARSTVISQTVMIWSASFAVFILDEKITGWIILGTLAIMLGASFLVYKETEEIRQRIHLSYYLFPALSALSYALAHLTAKYAFIYISSAALGMAIANTTSLIILLCVIPFKKSAALGAIESKGLLAILIGSTLQACGILVFWSSVKTGDLTQVIPLSRLSLLVIIFLSWLFFREQEAITWRVVAGGVIALAGAWAVAG
ncbi:MAG: DMT family transporter [Nitrospinaceae bacterium]|nr:DMT family transporter [Nitrospinaceae bacterium]